jgi:hypothetical protein
MATLTFASWNLVGKWLNGVDALLAGANPSCPFALSPVEELHTETSIIQP